MFTEHTGSTAPGASLARSLRARRPLRGFLGGAAGGLAGSGLKILGEMAFPPRAPGEIPPPALLADRLCQTLAGHPLSGPGNQVAVQAIHWTFGVLSGGVYGLAAEFAPVVTTGYGLGFAAVLLLCTHESGVPLAGLSAPPWRLPLKEHLSELFTHGLFGVATEAVRRWLR